MNDSILDSLLEEATNTLVSRKEEIIVPKRCILCKCSTVCSVLPTFISLSKIGIYISIEACPYSSPKKKQKEDDQQA